MPNASMLLLLGVLVSIQTCVQSLSVFSLQKWMMINSLLVENQACSPFPGGGGLSSLEPKLLLCLGLPQGDILLMNS